MARIPEHEVERLRKEISVQRLAEARGIKLMRHGADLVGLCPFHDDKTPSLVITPAKNLWHCLGACSAGGTAIDWVMKAEGVSFRHAVELLREDHLPLSASPIQPVKQSTVPKLPPLIDPRADDTKLLETVVGYYQKTLKESPEALKYLESRGLHSSEMIDRFRLGFANRTLGYHLPNANRAAGEAQRGRLQELGLFRETGHEHFTGSIVVPIFDGAGTALLQKLQKRSSAYYLWGSAPVLHPNILGPENYCNRAPRPTSSGEKGRNRVPASLAQGKRARKNVPRSLG